MRSLIIILVLVSLISKDEGKTVFLTRNKSWKLKEREYLFWLFQDGKVTNQELDEWQTNQEDRLNFVSYINNVPLKEIKNWQRQELEGFETAVNQYSSGKWEIIDWQEREEDRIDWLILKNGITHEDLEQWPNKYFHQLKILAGDYEIEIDEVMRYYHQELDRLSNLQVFENKKIDSQNSTSLQQNSTSAQQPKHIPKDEALFLKNELERLTKRVDEQQEEFKVTTKWQQSEIKRLEDIINHQNITIVDLQEKIKNWNKTQQFPSQENVSLGKNEELIKKELKLTENKENLEEKDLSTWKNSEREILLQLAQQLIKLPLIEFEEQLTADRERLELLAHQYNISVPEIEEWIRKEANNLGVVDSSTDWQDTQATAEVEAEDTTEGVHNQPEQNSENEDLFESKQWQVSEEQHIQQLLQEHTWSIEDLERKLTNDNEHLQQLANEYYLNVNEIEEWYHSELQKLLQNMKLYSENLTDWQKSEKQYLYKNIIDRNISTEEFKSIMSNNRNVSKELAERYNITMDELINWQHQELDHLAYLGYGKPNESGSQKNWQIIERKRLRIVPEMVNVTRGELLEFIESDRLFQNNLTANYEVSPQELLNFQGQELQVMENQGLLERLNLNHLEKWQRQERDRLYNLINTQSFTSKNLQLWQTDDKIERIAALYNLPLNIVRNWQMEEMQRIENIATHYNISLIVLDGFRNSELKRLQMVLHRDYLTEAEYSEWFKLEETRLSNNLVVLTGLSGAQLDKWRRRLFLLAQGLIDLDFNEGGSLLHNKYINNQRDHPPPVNQELKESGPELGEQTDIMPPNLPYSLSAPSPTYLPTREIWNQHYNYDHPSPYNPTFIRDYLQADGSEYNQIFRYLESHGPTYRQFQTSPIVYQNEGDMRHKQLLKEIPEYVGQRAIQTIVHYVPQQQLENYITEGIRAQHFQQESYQPEEN